MKGCGTEIDVRGIARRVAEYFNGSRDWDDLSDDERTGILTSKPTDGEPPWAATEGRGLAQLHVLPARSTDQP